MNGRKKTCYFILLLFFVSFLHSEDVEIEADSTALHPGQEGYTINYNTVSIVEYIRFASKVCNTNFIFNETDLNFTVTVVSDAPIIPQNVMATLLQVLRVHGLSILEQENNLLIHKTADVMQLATLVTEKGQEGNAPIVTRIFRIKNAKPDSLAAIIRPMISSSALLETSPETGQMILTDVTANVDKVTSLIEILDSPHNQLDIRSYNVLHNHPDNLVNLCNQIMSPIAQGNPFILVPQLSTNTIFIVSTPDLLNRVMNTLTSLDTMPKKQTGSRRPLRGENVFMYQAVHRDAKDLLDGLRGILENLQKSGILEDDLADTIESAQIVGESNATLFAGSKESMVKVKELLTSLDVPLKGGEIKNYFFVYRPQYRSVKDIDVELREVVGQLKGSGRSQEALNEMILGSKVNYTTNTLVFSGEESSFTQLKDLLSTIDVPGKKVVQQSNFFLYKIEHSPFEDLQSSLQAFAKDLGKAPVQDDGIVHAIHEMKYIPETNSILFTGSDAVLKRLKEVVSSFDLAITLLPVSNQFFIYKPKFQPEEHFVKFFNDISQDLKSDLYKDAALRRTVASMKYVKSNNSLLFTGDAGSIKRIEDLLVVFDTPIAEAMRQSFIIYPLKNVYEEKVRQHLDQVADVLKAKGDSNDAIKEENRDLIEAIRTKKWIADSKSFMFTGSKATLDQIQNLIQTIDVPMPSVQEEYFIYKIQATTGDLIEEDLNSLVKAFKKSGVKSDLIKVIERIQYIKETNSFLLTGDLKSINEVKKLISDYDYARTAAGPVNSNFFMYKPQHLPASQIQMSLSDVAAGLKKANLADPDLLNAVSSSKYVSATNSIVFTGNAEVLQKIQGLLKDIDVPPVAHAPIQHVGTTTFLLYKLKNAGGPQITKSIKSMTADLKKVDQADKEFLAALNSMKYVSETNSLLFTGTDEALAKVQGLVEQFDVISLAPSVPEPNIPTSPGQPNFYFYKPKALSGGELEKVLQDFSENLKMSGLADPDLFTALTSMRWVEKTQSLVFTGTPKALEQVQELVKAFDVPGKDAHQVAPLLEPQISSIDSTSFLVYKLQYHRGGEIQGALRQVAKDLLKNGAVINKNLLDSINSLQWLDVTNSLLISGDQETLIRLKELIKNLDIPLKQVFIEILVIETTTTNALQFGLEWGGNYQFNNKFGVSSFNVIPPENSGTPISQFVRNLSNWNPTSTTTTSTGLIPVGPSGGFDLGVVGDVIKHNGNTFLTLGSLLQALQTDIETSVITAPKIMGQDGRTTTIFSGANIPFTGSFINNTQSGASIQTANLEYRDIGLNLTITPVLGSSDIVTLDINLDRTQTLTDVLGSSINFQNQSASGIVTSKTTMQTTVHVPDRNFLILSGFLNNSNARTKTGLPCLGGLPLVGAAFSRANETVSGHNVVIFLRPVIVNSLEDIRRVTADQEDFFREQAFTPYLEHHYNEAMELFKTIDDE